MEWRSKREGLYVYMLLTHFAIQQKLTQHCKPTISRFKKRWGKFFFIAFLRDSAHSSLPSISLHPQMQALVNSEGWRRWEHLKYQWFPILLHVSLQLLSFPFLVRTGEIKDLLI